ncbi:MAG: hypothetical protein JWO43_573 [Candidatus Adlerbacteria bacterium]|nr:hypothetical protein [Candidatus Adlerbacteria bacterium]
MWVELQFTTLDGMIIRLRDCGIDVKNFDKVSVKKLHQLFEECNNKEAMLYYHKSRVWRFALTVKGVVFAENQRYLLRERYRIVNGRHTVKHNAVSLSETLIKGEDPIYTFIRCLKEEGGIEDVKPSQVFPMFSWKGLWGHDPEVRPGWEDYESSSYVGIRTAAHITLCGVNLPKRPWLDSVKSLMDNNGSTEIVTEWEDKLNPPIPKEFEKLLTQLENRAQAPH